MTLSNRTTFAMVALWLGAAGACFAQQLVPFAENGTLKMLYDNRMYPQAAEVGGKVYIVWRGAAGLPYIRSYDVESRKFSEPHMLLEGIDEDWDFRRFERDHHFAPVVWAEDDGRLHVLFGCHNTPGHHLASAPDRDLTQWAVAPRFDTSMSYPKIHRIFGDRTLVYFRHTGHLGYWTYRITADGGRTWSGPETPPVDLNAPPQDGYWASHAGSYHTTRVSADGRTLHVAFIWKVEDPMPNQRYNAILDDHTQRYNLYYLRVDLESGAVFNRAGKRLPKPVTKAVADRDCIVWDTAERVAAVGPSIELDDQDRPYFLLPVSGATPYRSRFYFIRYRDGEWVRTPLAETSHPFNSSHLVRTEDGSFRAYMITGEGESTYDKGETGMDAYGWGDRIEEWASDSDGENWKLVRDLTPKAGLQYQNLQFVQRPDGGISPGFLLFYGWKGDDAPGTGYLLLP